MAASQKETHAAAWKGLPQRCWVVVALFAAAGLLLYPYLAVFRTSLSHYHMTESTASGRECTNQNVYSGQYGSTVRANLAVFRTNLLSRIYQSFPDAGHLTGWQRFNPFEPFITCPPNRLISGFHRWRFCGLTQLRAPCLVYSVGPVQYDYAFEKEIIAQTRCEVHTFDCTQEGKAIDPNRHHFHRWCLGRNGTDHKTLEQIVEELGHFQGIDAMKIDMDGPDAEALSALHLNGPLPRQLAAEVHIRPATDTALPPETARTLPQVAMMFAHLANLGYGVISRNDNVGGQPGCCAEFSWLKVEHVCVPQAEAPAPTPTAAISNTTESATPAAASSSAVAITVADKAAPAAEAEPPKPPRAKRLVVSMASFPGRAEFAAPTVYSIMYGTRVPDALYFWVPVGVKRFDGKDEEVNGPKEIAREATMFNDQFKDVVKVASPKMDYGPATKLMPTLEVETDPDTVIITVDDDTYYSPTTVAELEDEILKRPGHAIVRSCEITHWDDKKAPPAKGWREWKLSEGACRGFMTAYASAAYRREFLDDLVFNQTRAPEGCLHHDDIWFSGHLWLRNVPIWVMSMAGRSWPPMYHRPKNRMSISMHPDAEKKAQECLDWFHWMDDENRRKELLGDRKPYQES